MGFWSNLFGTASEPRPKPMNVERVRSGYLPMTEHNIKLICERYNEKFTFGEVDGDLITYGGLDHKIRPYLSAFSTFQIEDCIADIDLCGSSCAFIPSRIPLAWEGIENRKLIPDEIYNLGAWNFLQDFINHGEVKKSSKFLVSEKLKYRTRDRFIFDDDGVELKWTNVNNGEYFIYETDRLYRFEDWEEVATHDYDVIWNVIKDKDCVRCDNPKKTHWKHFLELDAKKRAKRDKELRDWVDNILAKKVEYDDLNLKYGNLPAAPIVDASSFVNFCIMIHEDVKYRNYEIENYIMILRNKKEVEGRKIV